MNKRLSAVLGIAMLTVSPAQAFWGEGDTVFDPGVYGQVAKQYEQMKQLYDNAMKQLDHLASIEQTMNKANQAYQSLRNINMQQMWSSLKPGNGLQGTTTPIENLRGDINKTTSTASQDTSFVSYQIQQLDQLAKLASVQEASASDNRSATATGTQAPNQTQSSQITAASTSTLAALAASEERRRTEQQLAASRAQQNEADVFRDTSLYSAIGKSGRSSSSSVR
jgi:DNA repair exonuclease SbcCD ATPase subunit